MFYNYSSVENYARQQGIQLLPDKMAEFDQMAKAHGFTQAQVEIVMHLHIRHLAWIFDTKNFTLKQRILVALHFLLGRKCRGV